MVNKNYLSGVRLERKRKKELEAKGAYVIRSSGSHGVIDLVAVFPDNGKVVFIQCKKKSTAKTLRELKEFAKLYKVTVWLMTSKSTEEIEDWFMATS